MAITVVKKTEEVEYYITSDGTTHSKRWDAEYWEKNLEDIRISSSIHQMDLEMPLSFYGRFVSKTWFLVGNNEQMELLFRKYVVRTHGWVNGKYYGNGDRDSKASDYLSIGDWVTVLYRTDEEREDGGLLTLSYVFSEMKKFLNIIDEKTVSGKF